jgi:hypothetical protein
MRKIKVTLDGSMPCLCETCGKLYFLDCCWVDDNEDDWVVSILEDGTAVTWCFSG